MKMPKPETGGIDGSVVRYSLAMSDQMAEKVEMLASKTESGQKAEVFRKALVLYEVAENAKRDGHHLAIVDNKDKVLTRIVGL